MTIRLRYYLTIIPLFLGLGLANALLFFYVERREVEWGLHERASGIAISIAHLAPTAAPDDLTAILARLSERLSGLTIVRHTLVGDTWRSRTLHDSGRLPPPPPPDADQAEALAEGESVHIFTSLPGAFDENVAYAATPRRPGVPSAVYAIAEADTFLRSELTQIRRKCIIFNVILCFLGVGTAEFLTRWARREIAALVRVSQNLAGGDYTLRWKPGRIRELIDLGGTLATMASIFRESVLHTKRGFYQADLLPRDLELASTLQEYCDTASVLDAAQGRVHVRRLGSDTWDDFFGARTSATGTYVVVGRLAPPPGTDRLERILLANAARDYLLGCLPHRPPSEVWAELQRLFSCEFAQALRLPSLGRAALLFSHPEPAAATLPGTTAAAIAAAPGRGLLGTLSPIGRRRAASYLRQFSRHDIRAATDELVAMLRSRDRGVLLCYDFTQTIQPSSP